MAVLHCSKAARAVHAALTAFAMTISSAAAHAQNSVPNAMQGFSQNRNQKIEIDAATLEMRDKKKQATFAGNVKVVQGDTTMTSKTLVVFCESSASAANSKAKLAPIQSTTPGPGCSSSIQRLEARGDVVVTQKEQTVTGETAVFDARANLITMLGGASGVVLTQCRNVLRGDRLMVDMTTGVSRVESDSGHVHALVDQTRDKGCGTPTSGPATPSQPK
jgi:lipopolysaccharide export system protein LptA